jgi:hypothetical protein
MKCLGLKNQALNYTVPNYPVLLFIFPMQCLCVLFYSRSKQQLSLTGSKKLVCVVEMECVFFEVGIEWLRQLFASLL